MNAHRCAARWAGAFAGAVALAGCTNMSGLSGSSSYACKAPEGVICDSVSGTYANAVQNNLPSQKPRAVAPAHKERTATASASGAGATALPLRPTPTATAVATPMMPARSSARVLRLWFKPWEDADHDLYDQGYVYVQIDSGHWLMDHVQRQVRDSYAPLRPPPRTANEPKEGATPSAGPGNALRGPVPGSVPLGLAPSSVRPGTSD